MNHSSPIISWILTLLWLSFGPLFTANAAETDQIREGEVTVDWSGEATFQGIRQTGDRDLSQTHWNTQTGWYLSHLTFLVRQKNGLFDRVDVSARGWGSQGTVPTQTFQTSLKKKGLYTFALSHQKHSEIFALSDFLSGFHGSTSDRERTQASFTLQPLKDLRIGLRRGETRFTGNQGTVLHNPWDEFPLRNQTQWRSRSWGGHADILGKSLNLRLEHTYATQNKGESLSRDRNHSQGLDESDLTELRQFQGRNNHSGSSHHSKATFQYQGDVNVLARYERFERDIESSGSSERLETNPGGLERELRTQFTSQAERSVVGGELLGYWQFPTLPARVRVAVRDFHESIKSNAQEETHTLVFEFPTIVSSNSVRDIDLQHTGANLAVDVGPLGPWSLTLGGDVSQRTIQTSQTVNEWQTENETRQTGKALEAGVIFKNSGWKVSARQSIQDLDRDYTRRSPLEDRLSRLEIRHEDPRGWYVEGTATRRHQANTNLEYGESPLFESTIRTLYVGGGYLADRFTLQGGVAYMDLESQALIYEGDESAEQVPILIWDDFKDGSNRVNVTWKPRDGWEARLGVQTIHTSFFEAFRIEPHLRVRVSEKHNLWGDIGAFRYRYDVKDSDRFYRNDVIMIGFGTASRFLVR